MPLVIAAATSGSTTLQATDAVTATITLPSATDTLVGKTTPSFTTTIGVGAATPSASGAGITFPATQSASTNANTLDDYEEGTWTPVLGGAGGTSGQTYSYQNGSYVKIGKLVSVSFQLGLSAKGTITGNAIIQGLPFTATSDYSSSSLGFATMAVSLIGLRGASSSTNLLLYAETAAVSSWNDPLVTAQIGNTSQVAGFIVYQTA